MKEMHLVIVSPERMLFDGKVSQVTLPGRNGGISGVDKSCTYYFFTCSG